MTTKLHYVCNNSVRSEHNYPMYYADIMFCQGAKAIPFLAS